MMVNHPDVDICLVYQHLSKLQTHKMCIRDSYKRMEFPNPLFFDQKSFIKRCISGSYSLKKTDQNYFEYIAALENVFDKYSNCLLYTS